MKKRIFSCICAVLAAVMCFSVTACKDDPTTRKPKAETIQFYYDSNSAMAYQEAMRKAIKYWNDNLAADAGFEVKGTSNNSSNLNTTLAGSKNIPDLVEINDKYSQKIITANVLSPLEDLVSADVLSEIGPHLNDRYLSGKNSEGKYGPNVSGAALYSVSGAVTPCVLYYNEDAFREAGINIISVAEEDLAAYNTANGTNYLPHGYYAYATAPDTTTEPTTKNEYKLDVKNGMQATLESKTAYRVFNNLIPMNWDEYLALASVMTKEFNSSSRTTVGLASEYWFYLGWSIAGDCLAYDAEQEALQFSFLDQNPGYIVLKDNLNIADSSANVNTTYNKGDLVEYNEKAVIAENLEDYVIYDDSKSEPENADAQLYKIPSMYEAVKYFSALTMPNDKYVDEDGGMKGYDVAYDSTRVANSSYLTMFTSQTISMLYIGFSDSSKIGTTGLDWNIAPAPQYREFNDDGTLKTALGVDIEGYKACHSTDNSWAIPKNAENKERAATFLNWLCGDQAQTILAESGFYVTNNSELVDDASYANTFKSKQQKSDINIKAVLDSAKYTTPGDWCYTNDDGNWVNIWSVPFNGKVRTGQMTMKQLFENETDSNGNNIVSQVNTTVEGLPYIGIVSHNTIK